MSQGKLSMAKSIWKKSVKAKKKKDTKWSCKEKRLDDLGLVFWCWWDWQQLCDNLSGEKRSKTETKRETEPTVHQNKSIKPAGYKHSSFNILMWLFIGFQTQQGLETKTKLKNQAAKMFIFGHFSARKHSNEKFENVTKLTAKWVFPIATKIKIFFLNYYLFTTSHVAFTSKEDNHGSSKVSLKIRQCSRGQHSHTWKVSKGTCNFIPLVYWMTRNIQFNEYPNRNNTISDETHVTLGWFFPFSNILERDPHQVQQPASPEHHLSTQVGLTSVCV